MIFSRAEEPPPAQGEALGGSGAKLAAAVALLLIAGGVEAWRKFSPMLTSYLPDRFAEAAWSRFDPARDAARDIRDAGAAADRSGRRVLLDIGGDWCHGCRVLDEFYERNADLREFRDRRYVTVKVNITPGSLYPEALMRYPHLNAFPHLFVLGSGGGLACSVSIDELWSDAADAFDRGKFLGFMRRCAARP